MEWRCPAPYTVYGGTWLLRGVWLLGAKAAYGFEVCGGCVEGGLRSMPKPCRDTSVPALLYLLLRYICPMACLRWTVRWLIALVDCANGWLCRWVVACLVNTIRGAACVA